MSWAHAIGMALCLALAFPAWSQTPKVPSSLRSRNAISRVRPHLEAELKAKGFTWGAPIFVRIFKKSSVLELWIRSGERFRCFKRFPICTYGGRGPGPKTAQGDRRAPEGFYFVGPSQMNPYSRFHLSFNLGYPNAYDRFHSRTGSALMVHGACVSIGCFAMTDHAMEQIYALAHAALTHGQPFFRVHIFPFAMEDHLLNNHLNSRWIGFWKNLQTGYRWFNSHGIPPNVVVHNGRYIINDRV